MKRRIALSILFLAAMLGAARARAFEAAAPPLPAAARADFIVIDKSQHRLRLYEQGRLLRAYRVALGHGGLGPKLHGGDGRTPEGRYIIDGRNPHSAYHLSLHISYPAARDVAEAAARGESAGGDIMIHGLKNGLGWIGARHRALDWTAGCIGLTDAEIEEIWRVVPDGTVVEIRR
jgi:murein L,D-transpeptidase YafK